MPLQEQGTAANEPASPSTAGPSDIARVQVRIPPFWAADPEMWFAQIESQFLVANISRDDTKFGYVAGNLEARYAVEVRDILTNPPAEGKYLKLKSELIRRLSASQEQKTRRLLEQEVLGDKKPSQFLRYLQGLAGSAVPDNLLRSIWLSRLPSHMQAILTTQKATSLDAVAELADAIIEASPSFQVSAASVPPAPTMDALVQQFTTAMATMAAELRKEIASVASFQRSARPRSRSRSMSRPRSSTGGECWYHSNFGTRARKCRSPCSHKPSPSENSQGSR